MYLRDILLLRLCLHCAYSAACAPSGNNGLLTCRRFVRIFWTRNMQSASSVHGASISLQRAPLLASSELLLTPGLLPFIHLSASPRDLSLRFSRQRGWLPPDRCISAIYRLLQYLYMPSPCSRVYRASSLWLTSGRDIPPPVLDDAPFSCQPSMPVSLSRAFAWTLVAFSAGYADLPDGGRHFRLMDLRSLFAAMFLTVYSVRLRGRHYRG